MRSRRGLHLGDLPHDLAPFRSMTALLLSGGMDSITIAWWKQPSVAIFVDYGQLPAKAEEAAGRAAAEAVGLRYGTVRADCSALSSGDLAGRPAGSLAPVPDWCPLRHQLILTIAGAVSLPLHRPEIIEGRSVGRREREGGLSSGR